MILEVCKNGTIKLVSGGLETDGRVEVCIYIYSLLPMLLLCVIYISHIGSYI